MSLLSAKMVKTAWVPAFAGTIGSEEDQAAHLACARVVAALAVIAAGALG